MADITATARGSYNINRDRVVVDMSNKISLLKPSVTPLTVLLRRLRKNSTHNYRFDWLEDSLQGRWTSFEGVTEDGTVIVAGDTTDLLLVAGTRALIAVNDLIKNVTTGEVMRVTAYHATADTITVTRGYGTTAVDVLTHDDKLLVIGNAMMQGSGAPAEKHLNTTTQFNYTQIFKTPYSVTNTLEAMKLYGGGELNRLRTKKGEEHNMSMEYAFLFGERNLDVTGDQPVSTTAGLYSFLSGTDNVKSVGATVAVENDLDEFTEMIFYYGSTSKVWMCSPSVITFVNSIAKDRLELVQSDMDSTYGLAVTKLKSPHGILNMVHHPLLVNGYDGLSFALDMEEMAYRPLEGRDTKLKTNIQNADEDGQREMYITEAGLELRLAQKHGMFILT